MTVVNIKVDFLMKCETLPRFAPNLIENISKHYNRVFWRYPDPECGTGIFYMLYILIIQLHVKKNQTRSPITLTEKLNIEKRHFNTGPYDRLMTEAPSRVFGLIIFILGTKLEKLKTVSRLR